MKMLLVTRKSLLEMLREWQLLLLVLLLPLAFLAIIWMGYSTPILVTHPILIDMPGPDGELLAAQLATERYAGGRAVFDVLPMASFENPDEALQDQHVTALVRQKDGGAGVEIRGDALFLRFYQASTLIEEVLAKQSAELAGEPEVVRIEQQSLTPAGQGAVRGGPRSEFDLYAPGMMIFALMLIIPQTAMLVARESRWRTLRRLRLTRLRSAGLLGGISLSQLIMALLQVLIIFVGALTMGFQNQGSLPLAIVIGLAVGFSAIGCGLLVACFVENDSQAINVGSTVAMMQVFLSGAMYQLPPITLFTLAGHQIDLFDIFPATHGMSALQAVLCYGASPSQIGFRLAATLLLSLGYFGLGIVFFGRLKMRTSDT
jgi:ABC-2 type transport system permease protein